MATRIFEIVTKRIFSFPILLSVLSRCQFCFFELVGSHSLKPLLIVESVTVVDRKSELIVSACICNFVNRDENPNIYVVTHKSTEVDHVTRPTNRTNTGRLSNLAMICLGVGEEKPAS